MARPTQTSLIDRVNDLDVVVSRISRGDALTSGATFRTVHVLVFDLDGRLLLQQLSGKRERHQLRWGSSVAAYLHAGEQYEDAAARRMREEINIEAPISWQGKLQMNDGASKKWVGIFTSFADKLETFDETHIHDVEWRTVDMVRMDLDARPERFTPTFHRVFRYFDRRR